MNQTGCKHRLILDISAICDLDVRTQYRDEKDVFRLKLSSPVQETLLIILLYRFHLKAHRWDNFFSAQENLPANQHVLDS